MMHVPAADPVLPNFPMLFDGDAMRDLLSRHLAGTGTVEVTGVSPRYVRYKPQTSCLVSYDIDVRVDGEESIVQGHVRTFADDRGERRMHRRKLRELLERREALYGEPPATPALYLPEVNGMFSFFPVDYELRPLVEVASAGAMRPHLAKMLGQPDVIVSREPDLIRYKPGRKALFRYYVNDGGDRVLYGKIHTDERASLIRSATGTLIAAGLTTPEVVGTNPELGFIVHAEAPGTQLASMRDDSRYADLLIALAGPLTLLHRTQVDGLPVHHLGNEIDRLRETANLLGVILPGQQERLLRIVRIIEDHLARVDDELATNHGDFYDDQAIVDGDTISLIDLDEIRSAHPMLDVGNMLAHLRTGEQRGTVSPLARSAFIDAMRAHRVMDDHDLATFEAIGILKLAPGPFRRIETGWPESIDAMLALIEELLGVSVSPRLVGGAGIDTHPTPETHSRRRELPRTPQINCGGTEIRDDKLPELPALQDVSRMQDHLQAVTGDSSLELTGIHIQRHKPGRRAILRYDVSKRDPIWGKIFASKRGPRVFEITRLICEAGAFGPDVTLPDPVAFLPDLRVLLQKSVPGEPIIDALFAENASLGERIAKAIHALHTSGLDLGREHDLDKELSPLHQRVDEVSNLFPDLRDEAMALYARVLDLAGVVQRWRYLPVHRDFYHDQVLMQDGQLSVLDLDDAAMSEPVVDIANFAAHLDLLGLQQPAHERAIRLVRDRFLARSRELDPALDESLLAFLTASTLLRLAGIHAPRQDGHRVATGLLLTARESLAVIA